MRLLAKDEQLIGRTNRQQPEQRRIQDRKDRGVGADAERQRKNRNGCKTGASLDLPQRIQKIAPDSLHRTPAPHLARDFFDEKLVPERAPCILLRKPRRFSAIHTFPGVDGKMRPNFLVQVAAGLSAQQRAIDQGLQATVQHFSLIGRASERPLSPSPATSISILQPAIASFQPR